MKSHIEIARAAGTIAGMTAISRIFGFIRDILIASFFGTGMAADAFFVAFRIPNLLRNLLAEGSLSAGFVPVFTETYTREGRDNLWKLVKVIFSLMFAVSLILVVLGIMLAPWLVRIIAPGFIAFPDKLQLTINLTRLIFPYLFFIALAAVGMGALNSLKHFAIPAFSPAVFNISLIIFLVFVCRRIDIPIYGLAAAVVAGGIGQFLIQFPPLMRRGGGGGFSFNLKETWLAIKTHPQVRKIGILLTPAVFGLAIHQLSLLIDTLLASFLSQGSISYLYYGNRLMQLPLGVFGIALATAALPALSAQAAKKDLENFKKTLNFSLQSVLFISVPAIVGLIVLRFPIIRLLFAHGAFGEASVQGSAATLLFYSLGLCSYAGMKIVVAGFYALQDTRTPFKIGAVTLLINAILNLILMIPLKSGGIALATALSSTISLFILLSLLRRKIGPLDYGKLKDSFVRILSSALIMGVVCFWVSRGLAMGEMGIPERIIQVGAAIISGSGVYILASRLFGVKEMHFLKKIIPGK
ncbi:MAG: murein biosynthesis integral membrane protein MurJ [Candidatus Ratteibacteria bacterium]|nr:murein biosynthesis integral membrane protein MurJ [Candidatus Ratteibacteria bacterium]